MGERFDAIRVTPTEAAGTLSNGAASISANRLRRGLIVSNNSDTVMTLRIGGTADANTGISVPAGTAITFRDYVPTQALSLFCAGASKAYTVYEW